MTKQAFDQVAEGLHEALTLAKARESKDSQRAEVQELKAIIQDTLWMAQRYADGRMTYAVSMFNDALGKAQARGLALDVPRAKDGMFDK